MEQVIIKTVDTPKCMTCASEGTFIYKDLNDRYFGESKGWNLKKCNNPKCGLIWLDPMPAKEEIWKAYVAYYTHSGQKKSLLDFSFLEKPYQNIQYGYYSELSFFNKMTGYLVYLFPILRNKFDFNLLYLPCVKSGKILDFGCGNGWLLDNLKSAGWEAYGLDFDPKAIEFCNSKGLKAALGDIGSQNYPENYFDAITINHVIEHVHEVDQLIKDAFKVLKKGGKLIIATPNTDNWLHKVYKKFWFQLDPPRHLHIFNIDNLEVVVRRNGLEIERSFSSVRMDAWTAIVSRAITRKGTFRIGFEKKKLSDLMVGLFYQLISFILTRFNKKKGGEVIIIAYKK